MLCREWRELRSGRQWGRINGAGGSNARPEQNRRGRFSFWPMVAMKLTLTRTRKTGACGARLGTGRDIASLKNALANSPSLVYQSDVRKRGLVMDYKKLGRRDLNKILSFNPPDVPHYQRALEERKRRDQLWMLVVSCAAILLTVISSSFGRAKTFAPQVKQES